MVVIKLNNSVLWLRSCSLSVMLFVSVVVSMEIGVITFRAILVYVTQDNSFSLSAAQEARRLHTHD